MSKEIDEGIARREFGRRLRKLRQRAGIDALTMADDVGIGYPLILMIEDGYIDATEGQFARLAAKLEISMAELRSGLRVFAPHAKHIDMIHTRLFLLDEAQLELVDEFLADLLGPKPTSEEVPG